ncbi:hypothetical protein NPS70_14625 [Streptomyces sp. C10-9-1]|uniref:hypothetical protein n=1 Tax=Streptomyces sp. C10-9-1 TaxID=1859285 RepID=UPI0021114FBF|nr:hypothetical protein [Streptomyces sp. C10-9-1]MCQ6554418.1 hypothetical protein [Streptomyces sp. C10-9-1]
MTAAHPTGATASEAGERRAAEERDGAAGTGDTAHVDAVRAALAALDAICDPSAGAVPRRSARDGDAPGAAPRAAGPEPCPPAAPASDGPAPAPARSRSAGSARSRTGSARAEEQRSTAGAATAPLRDRFASGHRAPAPPRRGGDPVKGLLHRHRELCADAVDPLEIAAGLEAHGVTDRTAARYRHRDVFSLAEEMFARTDRTPPNGPAAPVPPGPEEGDDGSRGPGAGPLLRAAAPGAVCALAVVGAEAAGGALRIPVAAAGAAATLLALLLALRSGPLRAGRRATAPARLWTLWLIAYAVCGQGLVDALARGGPQGPPALTPVPLVPLAAAVLPAAWCAHLFAVRSRRRLSLSRGLDAFAAATRPLLLAVSALFTGALGLLLLATGVLVPPGTGLAGAAALGVLLFLARLLAVHGFPGTASAALAAACAVEALAPALLLAGRLPGLEPLARPVEALAGSAGPAAVPVLACTAAALALLARAFALLTRASAHTP